MGTPRGPSIVDFRGNTAYFAFVVIHAVAWEVVAVGWALLDGRGAGYQPLMFATTMFPLYLMLVPLSLAVALLNWWCRYTRVSYLLVAIGTFVCFDYAMLTAGGTYLLQVANVILVSTAAAAWLWENVRRRAGPPQRARPL